MERQLTKTKKKKHRASLPSKQNNELWRYCACTVTQTHRQGSPGRDLSLKRAISSAPQNICILMQGWTGREGTEERDSGISYQGFTHRVREQVHEALWRISRTTQTPTSAALGSSRNTARLQNFLPIQLKSASNSKILISPSYSGVRVIQNHTIEPEHQAQLQRGSERDRRSYLAQEHQEPNITKI